MADFLMIMHKDAPPTDPATWGAYIQRLNAAGVFEGGSGIGGGKCFRKAGAAPEITPTLGGYMRLQVRDLQEAERYLAGNPAYEAGGTVELRELPRS